jgi:arginine decarboxylase
MKWQTPDCIWPVSGAAEGITTLNAFDNALLAAGIGNLNLVKLSSVIPADVEMLSRRPDDMDDGALVPTIYSYRTSTLPGETVAAAIGFGIQKDGHGVAYEHHISGSATDAERVVREQVKAGFEQRGLTLDRVIVVSSEHKVEHIGCALAAVVLWWLP